MWDILIGALIFSIVLTVANHIFRKKYHFTYSEHFLFFTSLYLVASFIPLIWWPGLSTYVNFNTYTYIFIFTLLTYISFEYWWGRYVDVATVFGYETIPQHYRQIVHLTHRSAISKAAEIFMQQVCALLLFVGALKLGLSELYVYVVFTILAFILHIPAPRWFGKIYGSYFMWMATLLAPLEIYLLLEFESGFYLATSLHLFMYLVLYSSVYLLRQR